ncbi:Rv3235 family protein [Agromyces aerolatus]|uniref:Rv3235 family protein n=1 Tax=Agromyces sp. LY-1074 TaxID=3074080 RepID=UPI0028663030|nr:MULTISPECIES: Rv3235 family protein [unclassified Agromyces]MDR5699833.1 Rv3235 family protein [Agromyces sp. LY-1074]MDR5706355.1 Rv3235 family protein [Agromyces sp. LY-1358]
MPASAAATSAQHGSRSARLRNEDDDDFFAPQRTTTRELPDPEPLLRNLTYCAIEALAGARELEQLARWVTDDVYRRLQKRVILAARSRRARGVSAQRPVFSVGRIHRCEPADGIVEAVIIVHQRHRVRSVAIRLEGFDTRWRASVIAVL